MELTFKYINEFKQFGNIDIDLIVFDAKNEEEILFRISKNFKADVTEEEKTAHGLDAIQMYLNSFEVLE